MGDNEPGRYLRRALRLTVVAGALAAAAWTTITATAAPADPPAVLAADHGSRSHNDSRGHDGRGSHSSRHRGGNTTHQDSHDPLLPRNLR